MQDLQVELLGPPVTVRPDPKSGVFDAAMHHGTFVLFVHASLRIERWPALPHSGFRPLLTAPKSMERYRTGQAD
ncbi:MAG: Uncharacterised protein [SAR116 cluster bacterium]|nr:MAG: Uncharacterised protein [SAR116 cluster bacterium]